MLGGGGEIDRLFFSFALCLIGRGGHSRHRDVLGVVWSSVVRAPHVTWEPSAHKPKGIRSSPGKVGAETRRVMDFTGIRGLVVLVTIIATANR